MGRLNSSIGLSSREADLRQRIGGIRRRIAPHCVLWVSWPKRGSKVPTDLTEDGIRQIALALRRVDVCAVNEIWSGLKLVIPVADTRAGLWPAWWTLGTAREWPRGGEIDMMEYYQGLLLANVAWGSRRRWEPTWDSVRRRLAEFGDPGWSEKFHVWRMDWSRQRIDLYVDGQLLNTTDLAATVNPDPEAANLFHEPHYMLLNLAVGGAAGGDPEQTEFPARFEVDWVRVYQ